MAMPQTPQENENCNKLDLNGPTDQAANVDDEIGQPSKAETKMSEKEMDVQLDVKSADDNNDEFNQTIAELQREMEDLDILPIGEPINELSMQLEMILTWLVLTSERCCLGL